MPKSGSSKTTSAGRRSAAGRHDARIVAFQAVYRHEVTGESLDSLMDLSWMGPERRARFSEHMVEFARLLVGGVLAHLPEVDAVIEARLEHWDMSRLARVDLAVLRLGAYSLLFQPDIPAEVSIDEAIEISKQYGTDDSFRFVNGVLDAVHKHNNR